MKLKKLEIHNIASIEDAVIDFEAAPLVDSNVILITGETGSGKSTILDAICLALYATTPRMKNTEMDGTWQENDTDQMDITDTLQLMRKNTTEAYTRLSFLGSDGNVYEAEWHAERKRKNLNRTWSLNNLTHPEASPQPGNGKDGTKDNEMKQAIEAAVGLTFGQFCRTTMLAQGEFTRFLKSGNKEKASILEKITNTEQYAKIGEKIFDLTHHKYEVEMNEVDPSKKEQPLPQEQREALEENIKTIGNQLAALITLNEVTLRKANWLSTENKLLDNQKKAQEALTHARNTLETVAFKSAQQDLIDWDRTEDARKDLDTLQQASKTIEKANDSVQQLQTQYIILLNGLEYLHQEIGKTAEIIKIIDTEIQTEGGEPTSLEELNQKKEEMLTLMGHIQVAQAEVKAYFDKITAQETIKKKLEEQEKAIRNQKDRIGELRPKVDEKKKLFEELEAEYERLDLAVNTLAEKLRENLIVNHRCPICGQAVTSLDTVPHQQDLQVIVNNAKKKRDEAKNIYDNLNEQYRKLVVWVNQNEPAYQKDLEDFKNDQSLNKAHEGASHSIEKCGIKSLDEHTQKALEEIGQKTKTQKSQLDVRISRAEEREKQKRKLTDLRENKYHVLKVSIEQLLEKLPQWEPLTYQKVEALPDILNKMQLLTNLVTAELTNKESATDRLQHSRASLDAFLGEHKELSERRLEQLLSLKDKIVQQRLYVQGINDAFAKAQGALNTVTEQIEEHQKDKPAFDESETIESLQTASKNLQDQQKALNERLGSLNQKLSEDNSKIKKLAELKNEYEQKRAIFERWNKLDRLIGDSKGEKFRLIAQSYILANLVQAANVHMRTLTDRYTLHAVPGQELIILVEDAYQGGVKRPASTISGGESFLVSLALALALSEIGQSLKVETLFIDEGFGTLSGEPLAKAINTLESLHASNNRQVCAISHREEVKERIPVQIQVNQNPQSSSSTIDIIPHI